MNITRSDSHIPSAPAASMNQFQIPKGQNPLRLPFASFRLIFGLEKTTSPARMNPESRVEPDPAPRNERDRRTQELPRVISARLLL
jgi:hypothetical protein